MFKVYSLPPLTILALRLFLAQIKQKGEALLNTFGLIDAKRLLEILELTSVNSPTPWRVAGTKSGDILFHLNTGDAAFRNWPWVIPTGE
jgi:hypothetical protein